MAQITVLTSGSDEVDRTSYSTASISPSANALLLAAICNGPASGSANTPTLSGAGVTWVQIATINTGTTRQVTLFRALSASPSSGALTFDMGGQTQVRAYWIICQIPLVDTSGTNGSGAVIQSATNSSTGSASGITVTLSSFAKQSNITFGFAFRDTNASMSAGSGFIELANVDSTDSGIIEAEWQNSPNTSVNWTWSAVTTPAGAIAIEIKTLDIGGAGIFSAFM